MAFGMSLGKKIKSSKIKESLLSLWSNLLCSCSGHSTAQHTIIQTRLTVRQPTAAVGGGAFKSVGNAFWVESTCSLRVCAAERAQGELIGRLGFDSRCCPHWRGEDGPACTASRAIVLVTHPGREELLLHSSHPLFSAH